MRCRSDVSGLGSKFLGFGYDKLWEFWGVYFSYEFQGLVSKGSLSLTGFIFEIRRIHIPDQPLISWSSDDWCWSCHCCLDISKYRWYVHEDFLTLRYSASLFWLLGILPSSDLIIRKVMKIHMKNIDRKTKSNHKCITGWTTELRCCEAMFYYRPPMLWSNFCTFLIESMT